MTPTHHLTDETLQDYSAGNFDSAMETLVACHLTSCRYCRERAELADVVGGVMFSKAESMPVEMSARELLASASTRTETVSSLAVNSPAAGVPRPLGRLLPTDIDNLSWRWIAPGIRQYDLGGANDSEGAFKLLHLDPGATMMEHGHNDRELTYVVRGSYSDVTGRYRSGDIADMDAEVEHNPIVDSQTPCIALIATQSPVRYKSFLGRIAQPFVGI